jgi:hypothetical protein
VVTDLEEWNAHPRTPENLDVIRRWEKAKTSGWLTEERQKRLQDLEQEHILLIDENGGFELQPYERIENTGDERNGKIRAFVFTRQNKQWAVIWHTAGKGQIRLPIKQNALKVWKEPGGKQASLSSYTKGVVIPVSDRRYIEFQNLSREEVLKTFQDAE